MALRMKHWIGLVAGGIALVSAWLLPPSGADVRESTMKPLVEVQYESLMNDYRWTYEALRRVRWSDSLSALTVRSAESGVSIITPAVGAVRPELTNRLAEKTLREIEAFGGRHSDMTFGLIYQPLEHGRAEGMGGLGMDRTEMYIGSLNGSDYCLQVRMHRPNDLSEIVARDLVDTDRVPPRQGTLGPCRFYVKYGLAGAGVQRWLEEGGVGFALEAGSEKSMQSSYSRRTYLGIRSIARSRGAIDINQCLAGMAEGCARLLSTPRDERSGLGGSREIVRRSPAMYIAEQSIFGYIFRDEGFLLADLEQEFGAEAFNRFWTSDAEMTVAFEDAFGVDLGAWTLSWVESVMGIDPPGPGLPRSASSGSMLAVSLLLGIAFMRARKQKVA